MWNVIGKTGNKNAQKNVHCAQFSGHRDLDASVMVNFGFNPCGIVFVHWQMNKTMIIGNRI
jgi:hypothetical protein